MDGHCNLGRAWRIDCRRLAGRSSWAAQDGAICRLWTSLSYLVFADSAGLWHSDCSSSAMVLDALMSGMLYVSFTLCMQVSWPLVAATQFTAYMAMLNLSRTAGQGLNAT